jgi:Transcription factor WhiB
MINATLPPFLAALAPGQRTPCYRRPELYITNRPTPGRRRTRAAKTLCALCPVQQECADWAIDTAEPEGIWGGLTPDERAAARPPACGTETAWRRHVARSEGCHACREAHDERLRADRLERLAVEHAGPEGGSLAGYRLELLLGLPTCDRCRAVRVAYYADRPRPPKWYRRTGTGGPPAGRAA